MNYNFGSKENLIKFLKENLSVNIETIPLSKWVDIEVEVSLDGENVKTRNTSCDMSPENDYFS